MIAITDAKPGDLYHYHNRWNVLAMVIEVKPDTVTMYVMVSNNPFHPENNIECFMHDFFPWREF